MEFEGGVHAYPTNSIKNVQMHQQAFCWCICGDNFWCLCGRRCSLIINSVAVTSLLSSNNNTTNFNLHMPHKAGSGAQPIINPVYISTVAGSADAWLLSSADVESWMLPVEADPNSRIRTPLKRMKLLIIHLPNILQELLQLQNAGLWHPAPQRHTHTHIYIIML